MKDKQVKLDNDHHLNNQIISAQYGCSVEDVENIINQFGRIVVDRLKLVDAGAYHGLVLVFQMIFCRNTHQNKIVSDCQQHPRITGATRDNIQEFVRLSELANSTSTIDRSSNSRWKARDRSTLVRACIAKQERGPMHRRCYDEQCNVRRSVPCIYFFDCTCGRGCRCLPHEWAEG